MQGALDQLVRVRAELVAVTADQPVEKAADGAQRRLEIVGGDLGEQF
ncbi:MAG: hypothetical protein AAGC55_00045 [Myxococcota bacterium]